MEVLLIKIVLTNNALSWFKDEMNAEAGDAIRFFARYGGTSTLHESFSLGVSKEQPDEAVIKETIDDILFYIESRDLWYFVDHDLHVDVDPVLQEINYSYVKA